MAPVVGVNSSDDPWAPPASAAAFLSHYPNHRLETVRPEDLGQRRIGRHDYFRPACEALWPDVADWVNAAMAD
jgi:predicted alpha/beta hydrolase